MGKSLEGAPVVATTVLAAANFLASCAGPQCEMIRGGIVSATKRALTASAVLHCQDGNSSSVVEGTIICKDPKALPDGAIMCLDGMNIVISTHDPMTMP